MADRLVRFQEAFFDDLDRQLPAERGADGTPSATDFLLYDLPPIRDALAFDFDGTTTEVPGTAPLRVFLGTGSLVRGIAVYAFLAADHNVNVIAVDLDLAWDDDDR